MSQALWVRGEHAACAPLVLNGDYSALKGLFAVKGD